MRCFTFVLPLIAATMLFGPTQLSAQLREVTYEVQPPETELSTSASVRHSGIPPVRMPRYILAYPGMTPRTRRTDRGILVSPERLQNRPWWRYPLIGAGVGAAAGAAAGLLLMTSLDDPIVDPTIVIGFPAVVGAAGGALVGTLIHIGSN